VTVYLPRCRPHVTAIHRNNPPQYDKCVFLDADTLVTQPIDELFERPVAFAAAPDTVGESGEGGGAGWGVVGKRVATKRAGWKGYQWRV